MFLVSESLLIDYSSLSTSQLFHRDTALYLRRYVVEYLGSRQRNSSRDTGDISTATRVGQVVHQAVGWMDSIPVPNASPQSWTMGSVR